MNKTMHVLFAVLVSSLVIQPVFSQQVSQMDEVKVLARKPIPSTPMQASSNVFSLSSYAADGGDFLKHTPGLTAGRLGGRALDIVLRGQSQNQLNIIADNAFLFGAGPNRMDPPSSYLDIASYDVIDITKGYGSVMNGPGASGGAVVLKRSAPSIKSGGEIRGSSTAGYDSNHQAFQSGIRLVGGKDSLYTRAEYGLNNANNYRDGNDATVRSSFRDRRGHFSIGSNTQDRQLYLSYDGHRTDDALYPGALMDSPLTNSQTYRLGIAHQHLSSTIQNLDLSVYAALADHVMDNYSLRNNTGMKMGVATSSDTYGGKLKTDWLWGNQLLESSFEFRKNNRNADRFSGMSASQVNTSQSILWPGIELQEWGFATETTFETSESSRLIVGGRFDHVGVDYGRADHVSAATGRSPNDLYRQYYGYGASRKTENNLGGLIRKEKDLSDNVVLYSGLSRSVRTADATERGLASMMVMMGVNRSWVGNPNIAPEKHHQFDLGIIKKTQSKHLSASLYVNQVDDFILRDASRGQSGILVNANQADVYRNISALLYGIELEGNWQLNPSLQLSSDATYTHGENLELNKPLPQIPPLQGKLSLNWQAKKRLMLSNTLRWAVEQSRTDEDPTTGTGRDVTSTNGYAIVDTALTLTPKDKLTLKLGISNLFDVAYANHLNKSNISSATEVQVNEPGRSFFILGTKAF